MFFQKKRGFILTSFLCLTHSIAAFSETANELPALTETQCKEYLTDPKVCPEGLGVAECEQRNVDAILNVRIEQCKAYTSIVEEFPQYYVVNNTIWKDFKKLWSSFISWIALLGSGFLIEYFRRRANSYKEDVNKIFNWFADPLSKKTTEIFEQTGVNLILVGEGGVGKTSLIKALTSSPHVRPDVPTNDTQTYSMFHQVKVEGEDGKIYRKLIRI